MKKILLYWNGMASKQLSGGDIYVKKVIENINFPIDVVLSGRAREILNKDHLTTRNSIVIDSKTTDSLIGLLYLYLTRVIKGFFIAIRKRKEGIYDIVIATSPFVYDIIPAILSRTRKRVVIMFHILPERKGKNMTTKVRFLFASIEQKISLVIIQKFFDVILVGNEDLRQLMSVRFPSKEILVAHAGIDTSKVDSSIDVEKQGNMALFVGRLTHQKGVFDLLDVAEHIQSVHPDFRLVVVGDGPDRDRFTDAAKARSISSIEAVGFVSEAEKYKLMKEAKFFIFPSYEEGWGIALAEALYAECIAVTYEIKHYRSLFGEYPHYVDMGNVDALKKTMENVYTANVENSQKEFISQYDDNLVVEKVVNEIMR